MFNTSQADRTAQEGGHVGGHKVHSSVVVANVDHCCISLWINGGQWLDTGEKGVEISVGVQSCNIIVQVALRTQHVGSGIAILRPIIAAKNYINVPTHADALVGVGAHFSYACIGPIGFSEMIAFISTINIGIIGANSCCKKC